ncbi:MAG: hypothetical protein OXE50_02240 [Chloroflexi bacterium]|nr:hypothetical protein [Chloroflexota bacterium]
MLSQEQAQLREIYRGPHQPIVRAWAVLRAFGTLGVGRPPKDRNAPTARELATMANVSVRTIERARREIVAA